MTFKEQLKADNRNVFLNTTEFADIHTINDVEMPVIIDEDEIEENENVRNYESDGMFRVEKIIYVDFDSLGKAPVVHSSLKLDGKKLFVLNTSNSNDMLKIILGVKTA